MAQLHLYVPEDVVAQVQKRAKARNMTTSRYLSELVKRDIGKGWPEGFFTEVIGGWKGKPLQRSPQGKFELRDDL